MMNFIYNKYLGNFNSTGSILQYNTKKIFKLNPDYDPKDSNNQEPKYIKMETGDFPYALDEANRILNYFKTLNHSEFCTALLQPDFYKSYILTASRHIKDVVIPKIDLATELLNNESYRDHVGEIENYIKEYQNEIINVYTEATKYSKQAIIDNDLDANKDMLYSFLNGHPATIPLVTPTFLKVVNFVPEDIFINKYNAQSVISPKYLGSVTDLLSRKNNEEDGTQLSHSVSLKSGRLLYTSVHDFLNLLARRKLVVGFSFRIKLRDFAQLYSGLVVWLY